MTNRTPPNDKSAEKAILGLCLLDNAKVPEIIGLITPADFYYEKSRTMWQGIVTMAVDNKEITAASLYQHLGGKISAADIGGTMDGVPKAMDAKYYAAIIRDKARQRKVISAATRLVSAAYNGDEESMACLSGEIATTKQDSRRENTLTDSIRHWIEKSSGEFSVTDCYNSLPGVTPKDKGNIRQVLYRLKKEGVIEQSGNRDGHYRLIDQNLELMDYINAPTEGLEFDWPLDLHEVATIFPKDIIAIAGTWNAGKTAFAIDFVRRNMDAHDIYYFNCEMSASRLKDRLLKVDEVPLDKWRWHPYSRDDNFADVIRPDSVNIIDYLELVEDWWMVAKRMKEIHAKLNKGIAIVLLQKPENRDTGMGGEKGLQKPTLYVAIDPHKAKLVKVKSWKGDFNPNRYVVDFKLWHGWKFIPQGHWHSEEADYTFKKSSRNFNIGR